MQKLKNVLSAPKPLWAFLNVNCSKLLLFAGCVTLLHGSATQGIRLCICAVAIEVLDRIKFNDEDDKK